MVIAIGAADAVSLQFFQQVQRTQDVIRKFDPLLLVELAFRHVPKCDALLSRLYNGLGKCCSVSAFDFPTRRCRSSWSCEITSGVSV